MCAGYKIENERKKIEKDKADMERESIMLDNKRKRVELEALKKNPSAPSRTDSKTDRNAAVVAAAAGYPMLRRRVGRR